MNSSDSSLRLQRQVVESMFGEHLMLLSGDLVKSLANSEHPFWTDVARLLTDLQYTLPRPAILKPLGTFVVECLSEDPHTCLDGFPYQPFDFHPRNFSRMSPAPNRALPVFEAGFAHDVAIDKAIASIIGLKDAEGLEAKLMQARAYFTLPEFKRFLFQGITGSRYEFGRWAVIPVLMASHNIVCLDILTGPAKPRVTSLKLTGLLEGGKTIILRKPSYQQC